MNIPGADALSDFFMHWTDVIGFVAADYLSAYLVFPALNPLGRLGTATASAIDFGLKMSVARTGPLNSFIGGFGKGSSSSSTPNGV